MNHSSHYGNGTGGHRGGGGGGGGSNDGSKHYHSNPHVSLGSSQVGIEFSARPPCWFTFKEIFSALFKIIFTREQPRNKPVLTVMLTQIRLMSSARIQRCKTITCKEQ